MRRQSCQQDGAEQQRKRAAPPGHVCASAHGGVSGAQNRFAGADCPAGQLCRPADRRAHCPADCRMESVHVSPPFLCGSVCAAALFHAGGGIALRGACPPPCRLTAPLWCPQGGVSGWLAADRAVPEAARGACFFSRLPILPLAFFTAPLPRRGRIDPRPRSQSALPLRGRGRDYSFLMQGAAPLASPGLNPGGTYSPNKKGTRRGACHVCRLPTMPLVYFLSPIPPTPFPSGEGGD